MLYIYIYIYMCIYIYTYVCNYVNEDVYVYDTGHRINVYMYVYVH
jgi:hypothetical protein